LGFGRWVQILLLVFEGQENLSGALNLLKTKKEWICIHPPILQKPKKNELEPNPPSPQHFFFKKKQREDLYTTPCPFPKTKE